MEEFEDQQSHLPPHDYKSWPWLLITYLLIAIGLLGVFLPLLPTTPFMLLAAWTAPKGSPRLERWMYLHPTIGPILIAWREERAVSRSSKVLAIMVMTSSWVLLWYLESKKFVLIFLAIMFVSVSAFLLSLPVPSSDGKKPGSNE